MTCDHSYSLRSVLGENNDLLYSCNDRPDYLSVYYHRSKARSNDKGQWVISRPEEGFRFYCAYDNKNKSDIYPGLWHIENGNTYIGDDYELIAYFPAPKNNNESWHGFPFTFGRKSPPDRIKALKDVAERLFAQKKLSLGRITKIRNGVL